MSETKLFIQRFITGFELSDGLYITVVAVMGLLVFVMVTAVSYTHLTLPTKA